MSRKEKLALIAVVVYMAIMMSGMYVMHHVKGLTYGKPEMMTVLVYFQIAATISALVFYMLFFRGQAFRKPRMNLFLVEFFVAAIVLVVLQITLGKYGDADMSLIWTIVGTTIMVGIGEEMIFRGILMGAVREKRGAYVAVLWSAGVFGFLHSTNILGGQAVGPTLAQVLSAGLSGVLYAWVVIKVRNVIPTMVYHAVWDMFILLGLVVTVSQAEIVLQFQSLFEIVASVVILVMIIRHLRSGRRDEDDELPAAAT
ncbi:MAG: hypothetical protein CSA55_05890 [Ilumatobacter coccineus]|uniref:CAAX prenyl protease 2/Lysostaphin resistance protein A-like domain-containing protein n=1 Tax=Ilumatobacter coccineus TaxID=467094 RepID=A0A2G6K6Q4_9ACTN|nr:MAG: hypothetical protein CSA55_05890 [Ilumatobacter coccineus]